MKFRLQKIAGLSGGGLPIRPPDATGALRKPVVEARGRPPPVADLKRHALSQPIVPPQRSRPASSEMRSMWLSLFPRAVSTPGKDLKALRALTCRR